MIAPDIGLYHPDGGEIFLDNAVYQVDGSLHHAVKGAYPADNLKQQKAQNRRGDEKNYGQLRINKEGSSQCCQHHHRRAESGPQSGGDGVLDGGNIAGQTGYQGRFAEVICIGEGKLLQLGKLLFADLSAYPLSAGGGEAGVALPQSQGNESHTNHLQALYNDIALISQGHAHIDNIGHHQRDNQLKDGFRLNAQNGQNGLPAVGLYAG